MKWTLPSLNLDTSIVANMGFCQKPVLNRLANSIYPDEMACYELSHQDLHCLQRHPYWSAGMKGLIIIKKKFFIKTLDKTIFFSYFFWRHLLWVLIRSA